MNISGVKSLNERLSIIESKVDNGGKDLNIIDKMLMDKKQKDKNDRNRQYEKIILLYNETIKKLIPYDIMKNLSRVIEVTARFIEEHSKLIASLFDLIHSSDFKLQLCIDLIKSIIQIHDLDSLISTINHIVELIFPHKTDDKQSEFKKQKKKKSLFGTLNLR
jgi:hypothetical protein